MPNILSRAELLLQAKNYSGTGAWLDESGNSHNAQFGSTAGADTNDPEFLAHSGDNYLRLPGAAGNYVSSADVNLLDADTAHMHQSKGAWAIVTGLTTLAQDQTLTPVFGDYHLKGVASGSAASTSFVPSATVAVSPSTEYTYSVWVSTDTADRVATLGINWYTAAVGFISGDNSTQAALTVGEWTLFTLTATSPATAAYGRLGWIFRKTDTSNADSGDEVYLDAACLRAGSDGTFVPSLRIVGDLDVRAKMSATDWTPADDDVLIGSYAGMPPFFTAFRTSTVNNNIEFQRTDNAGVERGYTCTSGLTLTDGDVATLRIVHDISEDDALFYQNDVLAQTVSGGGWTFGQTLVNNAIHVGSRGVTDGRNWSGNVYWAEVRDGIDGPVVARYDADDAAEPFATQTGATDGRTWTYNRSGSGLYVVDRPAFGLHTDDYFEVADHADLDFAAAESLTALAVVRDYEYDSAGEQVYVTKRGSSAAADAGWYLRKGYGFIGVEIADGTLEASANEATEPTNNTMAVLTIRRDVPNDSLDVLFDGVEQVTVEDTTTGSLANALPLRIGRYSGGSTSYLDAEVMAVALFREALTDAEIAAVGNALAGLAPGTGEYTDQEALGAIRNRLLYEGTHTEATAPRELVGALNAFLGTTSGDVEGALNEKIGSGYVGVVQACNTLLAGNATVYEVNDGLRKLAELYVP